MRRTGAQVYIRLADTDITLADLLTEVAEATYIATHNGYRVGRTVFMLDPFTLDEGGRV